MLLMMKDIPVMRVDFDEALYEILDETLIPYQIKGKLQHYDFNPQAGMQYNLSQMNIASRKNERAFVSFLASRTLPLDRENAKKILNLLKLEQSQDPFSRAKIALSCRGVSLQDNYWVKMDGDSASWKDVDIRQNPLNQIVAQVALHGSSLTLQGRAHTPELTTHGTYAKCWVREEDGLYLYKRGFRGTAEAQIEVEVSGILDKCNVSHLKYESAASEGEYCCKCKCMTSDDISILSGSDFISYCNVNSKHSQSEWYRIDAESMYKMFIVDYLISNSDRHGMNWGYFYDCNTMEILGCHPLYDHNNAFDRQAMMDSSGGPSLFYEGKSLRQIALYAMQKVDFHFTGRITREDFIVESHYRSFRERARELGVL